MVARETAAGQIAGRLTGIGRQGVQQGGVAGRRR